MSATDTGNPTYVAAALTLYLDLPDTPLRPSPLGPWLWNRRPQQAAPSAWVEAALPPAPLRRRSSPSQLPPLPKLRSLAYFLPGTAHLQRFPMRGGSLRCRRVKPRRLSRA